MKKIIKNLKFKNIRITPQRLEIINFLETNPIHPSAFDIFIEVRKKLSAISLATVYNTLDKLQEEGEIIKLQMANSNKAKYEYNLNDHSHFVCNECDKIYDVWNDIKEKQDIDGHLIQSEKIYYQGVCKNCLSSNGNKKTYKKRRN
ncbi:MAG: transcriptional repressor [bacterium]|nr:transcriptional repressor [bacterium]